MTEKKRVLVISSVANNLGAESHLDHLACFVRYSKHEIFYHNFVYDVDVDFDFSPFDAIVIGHNFWPEILSAKQRAAFKKADAVKIQFLQDEYQYVRTINGYLEEMGVNVMFSCVAEKNFEDFYPKSIMTSLEAVYPALTGYVTEKLANRRLRKRGPRPIDIGYRSRVSPYYLGMIGHEKLRIAEQFQQIGDEQGFSHNISVRENDRIYGPAWIKFLQSTRFQLGTPSGASIVDMDGSIIEAETDFRRMNPHSSFDTVFENILAPHEGKLVIDTVSPRIFEYAATGAVMVMHEGFYGGYLEPGKHYIEVKKDYSNIADVVDAMRDKALCAQLADAAQQDLVLSGRFSYRTFVNQVDDAVDKHAVHLPASRRTVTHDAFDQQMIDRHDQALFFDPTGWRLATSDTGLALKEDVARKDKLLRTPFLGAALRRSGGDPLAKAEKGRAAYELVRGIPEFRRLFRSWLFNSQLRRLVTVDQLLRDIFHLGCIKVAQSGWPASQQHFNVAFRRDASEGRLLLTGMPTDSGTSAPLEAVLSDVDADALAFLDKTKQFLIEQKSASICWDMTPVFPLQQFGVAITVPWVIAGKSLTLRSDPDEFFHFEALDRLAPYLPGDIAHALWIALTPSYGKDRDALSIAFNGKGSA